METLQSCLFCWFYLLKGENMTFVGRVDGNPAIVFILMVLFVKGREHDIRGTR